MKKQLSLLACLLVAATAAVAQTSTDSTQTKQAEPQSWQRYTVNADRFSVTLPTVPAMTTYKTLIWHLQKTRRARMIGAYADGAVYSVYVSENIPRRSLNEFISEQNRRDRWDISTETMVTVNDIKGKQYSSRGKPVSETSQLFAAEGRLYEFSVTGNPAEDAARQFFSSIVLDKKADGIELHDGEGRPFPNPVCDPVLTGKDVDNKVRVVMKPEPSYTELARQKQVVGAVIIKAIFACNGAVTSIRTVKELPHGLTEQAIAASRKIKFIPAVKNGTYVSMWLQLEYHFNLY